MSLACGASLARATRASVLARGLPRRAAVRCNKVPLHLRRAAAVVSEAAPAVGAFGIPEAVAYGAADAGTAACGSRASPSAPPPAGACSAAVLELCQELTKSVGEAVAAAEAAGLPPDVAGMQHLILRGVHVAHEATLEEFTHLAVTFENCCLRLALRDSLPALVQLLRGAGSEAVPSAVRLLTCYGRASLFTTELFEFLGQRVGDMQAAEVATLAYEAGRHGLRCRQFGELATPRAVELLPQMSLDEVMRAWQGLLRFSRDRRPFYMAARGRVQAEVGNLSVPMLLIALRVARDLRHMEGFVDLHAAVCAELVRKQDALSPGEAANALVHVIFAPKYRAQAQTLVRAVLTKWQTEDLTSLRVVEVVDALECFASWGAATPHVLMRLDEKLVESKVELQYAGNVGLWCRAVLHLAKLDAVGAKWPLAALELARDPHFLDKNAFHEQTAVVEAFGRLRLFDEAAYGNVATTVVQDISLFRANVSEMAGFVQAFVDAGFFHEAALESCYDHLLGLMEDETLDLSNRKTHQAIIQLAWSFAVAGLHQRHESFAAVLDYAYFMDLDRRANTKLVEQLTELADLVALESPELVEHTQVADKLRAARGSSRARSLMMSRPVSGDQRLMQEVSVAVKELGWQHVVGQVPDDLTAVRVDLSLEKQAGRKVGLLVPGPRDFVSCGLPDEDQPRREGARITLARRLLEGRGWSLSVVERDHWDSLAPEERRAFLEAALAAAPP